MLMQVFGEWTFEIYHCRVLEMCTKLKNPHLKYSCYLNDKEVECTNDQYMYGTKLHLSCSLPYHHPDHDEIVCNDDGEWNVKHVKCVPG